jgi:membrane protease YdiL (CAAX protease family)
MPARLPAPGQVLAALILAQLFWWVIFGLRLVPFWLGLSLATIILTGLSLRWGGNPLSRKDVGVASACAGLCGAGLLYAVFALGQWVSGSVFSFAPEQVGAVYAMRGETHPALIAAVLLFLTSPCEEIFWRGFVQRAVTARFGAPAGWMLASLLYAGVHVASGNFMLTGAALVAGMFWGGLYLRTRNLFSCIISHALWTVVIFLLVPIPN